MEYTQDYHLSRLKFLCRLCRMKKITDENYKNMKRAKDFYGEIKEIFSYDLKNDIASVHPEFICNTCRRKLQNYQKELCKVVQTDIATFASHTPEDCTLCSRKRGLVKHKYSLKKSVDEKEITQKEITQKTVEKKMTKEILCSEACHHNFVMTSDTDTSYCFSKFVLSDNGSLSMEISVRVFLDFSWRVYIYETEISPTCQPLEDFPRYITVANAPDFFSHLNQLKSCPGNNDFPEVIKNKLLHDMDLNFYDKRKNVKAKIENKRFESTNFLTTIRVVSCWKIVSCQNIRCPECQSYRPQLNTRSSRAAKEESLVSLKKNVPNMYLPRKNLEKKAKELQKDRCILKQSNDRLLKRIDKLAVSESVEINSETSDVIVSVVNKNESGFPPDSPKHLLWEQQKKLCQLKKTSSMRWHPIMIRWCLSIYLKSPGAYEHLRRSGFIELPHRTTLNKYTGFASSSSGFNVEIIKRLCEDSDITKMKRHEKQVILLFDELKIKSGLVYSKSSGRVIGFTELGDMNDELDEFERRMSDNKPKKLATYVLCFMVRGLVKRLCFPVGYFSSRGFDSAQLFPTVWQAIRVLETVGFQVAAMVCDGASPNRRFYRIHELADGGNKSPDGVVYWIYNRFDKRRKIYLFCDVPHLLKTIRNNFENSHGHNNTRNLMYNNQEISWQHLINLYEWDLGMRRFAPGWRLLHKLTEDHITLTPRLRMRVNLAAQILSSSVADGFAHRGFDYTKSTKKFIRLTDMFFDCLNVTTTYQGVKSKKAALYPYKEPNDWRFKWLKDVYLDFINSWKAESEQIENISKEMKSRLCLSYQTIEGIRITIRAFVELVPQLLQMDGVDIFLSDKLNQDPLEEHFGMVRSGGGASDNPTQERFGQMNRKIVLVKSDMIQVTRGNTRGRVRENVAIGVHDERQLPKRPKK